jgi:hypothetical protein
LGSFVATILTEQQRLCRQRCHMLHLSP